MLARNKLNIIENKISEALINCEISQKDFMTIIIEESIRMMNSERSDTEKINLIKEGKKICIDKVIKYEIISKS